MDSCRRDELDAAYRRATYRAGEIVLIVGVFSPDADRLLTSLGAESWAFLTACNPLSEVLPDEENALRMLRLRAGIPAACLVLEGEGACPEGRWREASYLVLGIREDEATLLAREHRQLAYLFGIRGKPAQLVWTA